MKKCCKNISGWFCFGVAVGFLAGLSYFVFMVYEGSKNDAPRNKNCSPGTTQCAPMLNHEIGEQ
jgi:hypothetical protein